jgi:hypothetical protein
MALFHLMPGKSKSQHRQQQPQQNTQKRTSKNKLGFFMHTVQINERVTKIENIKTDSTKILRPTHFSGPKDIKTD